MPLLVPNIFILLGMAFELHVYIGTKRDHLEAMRAGIVNHLFEQLTAHTFSF